jgi:sorting nexin-25
MIHDLYFSGSIVAPAFSTISKKHVDIIRDFVRNHPDPTQAAQRRVRRSVLLAQRQIEKDMEQDFEDFERSDLWFRVLNDTDFSGTDTRDVNRHSVILSQSLPLTNSEQHLPSHFVSDGTSPASSSAFTIQRTASAGSFLSSKPTNNIGVLMSPISSETGAESTRAPLFNDAEDELQREEEKRMEAIHAALTDIMAVENEETGPSLFRDDSTDVDELLKTSSTLNKGKHRGVFDDVEPEEPDEGDEGGLENSITGENHPYRPAGPGDLQLSFEIDRLGDKITHLEAQESMLDNLIRKAELTGDTQELKLLNKSKWSMSRELRELRFQKTQYEQQENANRLISDRTKVSIVSSTVNEESGKSVVRYLVEVQQLAADGSFASGWVVARRYNEFFNMHNRLREKYALVKNLDFPGKTLVTALSGSFVDMRKAALEKYLQVCSSSPLVHSSVVQQLHRASSPFPSYARATNSEHFFHATHLSLPETQTLH